MSRKTIYLGYALAALIVTASTPVIAQTTGLFEKIGKMWSSDPKDAVVISVEYSKERCSQKEYPLLVVIENNSNEDITSLEFLAYVHDDQYSRAECAESYSLEDRVIKSGESYSECRSTLGSKDIYYNDFKITEEYLADQFELGMMASIDKYGHKGQDAKGFTAEWYLNHARKTSSVNPRQGWGCRNISASMPWKSKITNLEIFSGL